MSLTSTYDRGTLVFDMKHEEFYFFEMKFNGFAMSVRVPGKFVGIDQDGNQIPELQMRWNTDIRKATPEECVALKFMGVK